jgi:hypothetical protein
MDKQSDPRSPFRAGSQLAQGAHRAKELVALNFRVRLEFRKRVKLAATERGVTMTELLSEAIERFLQDS